MSSITLEPIEAKKRKWHWKTVFAVLVTIACLTAFAVTAGQSFSREGDSVFVKQQTAALQNAGFTNISVTAGNAIYDKVATAAVTVEHACVRTLTWEKIGASGTVWTLHDGVDTIYIVTSRAALAKKPGVCNH